MIIIKRETILITHDLMNREKNTNRTIKLNYDEAGKSIGKNTKLIIKFKKKTNHNTKSTKFKSSRIQQNFSDRK